MSWPIDFHPEVHGEVDAAHDWYEAKRERLGVEFLDELQSVIQEISDNPQRFGICEGDIREGLLPRFPYAIFYRVLRNRIRILAIYHTSRDATSWQHRK